MGVQTIKARRWARYTAYGAIHNSPKRHSDPRCHPQNREEIQTRILELVKAMESQSSDHPSARIIWLSGSFGTGKSAIQQTIAEECYEAGTLAASFFFSHQSSERNNSRRFVPTIAWQVAKTIPDAHQHIEATAMGLTDSRTPSYDPFPSVPSVPSVPKPTPPTTATNYPLQPDLSVGLFRGKGDVLASLVEKDLASQLSAFIIEPLKLAANNNKFESQDTSSHMPQPNVLIVDGLDECKDEEQQLEIIAALHAAVIEHKLPFLIIISSRPEEAIERCFSQLWSPIFERIDLDKMSQNADKDIELVLHATFHDICKRHDIAPGKWPEEGDIAQLVRNASGHFIYMAIALKLINGPYPQEILKTIVAKSRNTGHPSAHLDVLYSLILKRCNNPKQAVITLLAINQYSWFRRIDVEHFFHEEIDTNLFPLFKSMEARADTDSHVVFYHKSVTDFLDDPLRSEELYVGQHTFYEEILPYYLDFYNGTSERLDDNQVFTREQLQELHDDFLSIRPCFVVGTIFSRDVVKLPLGFPSRPTRV
ncbi:hypothetical protein FA15DRAFT_673869 [Coprinopsis marcescibilis]|uniref:Nephrocystin 3-like N-terminal domain-containing protein n=1 Tax=Coprinopsis marcescibilis TaxID=230819 RepID=A0A5C3KIU9_COPMA|nr:hypothetical protein FA15DRAFT_673869 [Coprinopsis marcescibilis]